MTGQPFKALLLDLFRQDHQDVATFLQDLSETERAAIGTPDLYAFLLGNGYEHNDEGVPLGSGRASSHGCLLRARPSCLPLSALH